MTDIRFWENTAGANDKGAPPDYVPENATFIHQFNDWGREQQASNRRWYEDAEWTWGFPSDTVTVTVSDATTLLISGDQTAQYVVGRRIRVVGTATGTIYGTIVSSSFSAGNTTVVAAWDSGAMTVEAVICSVQNQARAPQTFLGQAKLYGIASAERLWATGTSGGPSAQWQYHALEYTDAAGLTIIDANATLSCDLSTVGLGGRDNTATSGNQWMAVFALRDDAGTLKTTIASPAASFTLLPSINFDISAYRFRALLGFVFITNAAGTSTRDFRQVNNHHWSPNVLAVSDGQATTPSAVSMAPFVPPLTKRAICNVRRRYVTLTGGLKVLFGIEAGLLIGVQNFDQPLASAGIDQTEPGMLGLDDSGNLYYQISNGDGRLNLEVIGGEMRGGG